MAEQATEAPDRIWMTYEQAAAYCNVDRVTLWRSVKRGELHAGGVGRAVRFHRDDLEEFMRNGGDASGR